MADSIPVDNSTEEVVDEVQNEIPETDALPEESKNENEETNTAASDEEEEDVYQSLLDQPPPTLDILANSMFIHNRKLAAKKILDFIQKAGSNQEELQSVISFMCKLSEDEEAMVRCELVQQIPSIALFCHNHSPDLKIVIRQQLVPYTVKLMNDSQIMVCKLGQSALLELLENNLIDQSQLSEWICPYISQLVMCDTNVEELRIEDITLMTKMIPLVSKDITMKYFLEPFVSLCCDSIYGIRKVCAMAFGTLCKIAGTEATELSLLPAFLNLCNDDLWGVRKACADVFVDVANVVTASIRRDVLPHIFINLLNDASCYVRNAAYQSLGGFICTYADSSVTGCVYENGKLQVLETDPTKNTEISSQSNTIVTVVDNEWWTSLGDSFDNDLNNKDNYNCIDSSAIKLSSAIFRSKSKEGDGKLFRNYESRIESAPQPSLDVIASNSHVYVHMDNENVFNNFQYWRVPLPDIEVNIDIEDGKATNIHVRAKVPGRDSKQVCASEVNVRIEPKEEVNSLESSVDPGVSKMRFHTDCSNTFSHSESELLDDIEISKSFKKAVLTLIKEDSSDVSEAVCNTIQNNECKTAQSNSKPMFQVMDQNIVPSELLLRFVSATDHQHTSFVSTLGKQNYDERIGYCAYSFPAVAFTLGRKYWPCIRHVCRTLAHNAKWTIRRTVASSLHELALILGHDITVADLFPIFLDLLKDVDEVRLKLVLHLADFLKHLGPDERSQFLPLIEEFTKVDNERNWRFRCTVAEQLKPASELYSSYDVYMYFMPIALCLIKDKVAAVRRAAVELMAALVKQLSDSKCFSLRILDAALRQANKWILRQSYVLLCEQLAKQRSLSEEVYVEEIVPHLFSLAYDVVPNVRLAVSRCLALTLLPLGYISSIESARHELLIQVLYALQSDTDADVKYFAELCSRNFYPLPQKELSPV